MKFTTHHPQGLVKIGDTLFVSSVEVKVRTRRFPQPIDGYDRDVGEGIGHLFKIDLKGNLLAELDAWRRHHLSSRWHRLRRPLHLGARQPSTGRTADRSSIASIPATMKAKRCFASPIPSAAWCTTRDDHTLHGVSWGSRRFYRWTLGRGGKVTNAAVPPERLRTLNTVALSGLSGLQVRRTPSHAVYRRDRDAPVADRAVVPARRASISWISAMAVRCTRCRSCSGPQGDWT